MLYLEIPVRVQSLGQVHGGGGGGGPGAGAGAGSPHQGGRVAGARPGPGRGRGRPAPGVSLAVVPRPHRLEDVLHPLLAPPVPYTLLRPALCPPLCPAQAAGPLPGPGVQSPLMQHARGGEGCRRALDTIFTITNVYYVLLYYASYSRLTRFCINLPNFQGFSCRNVCKI